MLKILVFQRLQQVQSPTSSILHSGVTDSSSAKSELPEFHTALFYFYF